MLLKRLKIYLVKMVLKSETIPTGNLLNVDPFQNNVHCSLGKSIFMIRHVKVNCHFCQVCVLILYCVLSRNQ